MSAVKQKYVVFDNFFAMIVPPAESHESAKLEGKTPTSAGFFRLFINEQGKMDVCCYGDSHTLNLSTDFNDAQLLKFTLGIDLK